VVDRVTPAGATRDRRSHWRHLFPLERPREAAQAVIEMIEELRKA
jgi:hypothetical protein